MLGLHSGDGHVMWWLAFPEGQTHQQMFVWRSSHNPQKAPEMLALHSSGTTSSYSIVDAHTGREVSSGTVNFPVSQVMCNVQGCHSHEQPHLMVSVYGATGADTDCITDYVKLDSQRMLTDMCMQISAVYHVNLLLVM